MLAPWRGNCPGVTRSLEDRHLRAIDQLVESALPLSLLLVGAQQALDWHLQGRGPDTPLYSMSEPVLISGFLHIHHNKIPGHFQDIPGHIFSFSGHRKNLLK